MTQPLKKRGVVRAGRRTLDPADYPARVFGTKGRLDGLGVANPVLRKMAAGPIEKRVDQS
jgi:hypothetical protein